MLGVEKNGSTYLLVDENQWRQIIEKLSRSVTLDSSQRTPDEALKYAALSPITFRSPEELQEKMKTYQQKKTYRQKKHKGTDTSQANKQFNQEYLARAAFEHQR